MSDTLTYQQMGRAARDQAHALFAQTMGYVAATAALFALGAWAGHDLTGGLGIVAFIAAFACLIGMQFAVRRSLPLTVTLLGAFGLLIGLAVAPTVAYYGSMDPRALWEAGGATALFIAGFGAAGYATRRDLAPVARASFWALVALIVFGIVHVRVCRVPHSCVIGGPPGQRARISWMLLMPGHLSSWPKICRKNRNTFKMSRKIDAASSGADAASVLVRTRWKSNRVNPAKITRPSTE